MSYLELEIPGRRELVRLSSGTVHATQGRIGAEDIGVPNPFARYRLRPEDIAGLGALPAGLAPAILRQAFDTLTLETQVTPTITVDDPFGPTVPSTVGQFVKPKITLSGPLGRTSFAPWGEPSRGVRMAIAAGAAITLGGLLYFAVKGLRA